VVRVTLCDSLLQQSDVLFIVFLQALPDYAAIRFSLVGYWQIVNEIPHPAFCVSQETLCQVDHEIAHRLHCEV